MQHSSSIQRDGTCKVFFSYPDFTVLLRMRDTVIVKAAPIAERFEGQSIGALTTWAQSRFGGPIIVKELRQFGRFPEGSGNGGPTAVHGVSDK
jgi:hypothetical protein